MVAEEVEAALDPADDLAQTETWPSSSRHATRNRIYCDASVRMCPNATSAAGLQYTALQAGMQLSGLAKAGLFHLTP
jgi:hypothetical protein